MQLYNMNTTKSKHVYDVLTLPIDTKERYYFMF